MPFAVQTSYSQTYQYGRYNSKPGYTDTAFDTEFMGKATSRTTSSSDGKNIGIMTIGSRGFIAEYADSSTEQDPIIKVGDYEVRVNDVDPKNATEIEMFALTSYMDDKGLTGNTGMKTFNKMRAYSSQAEYNGFCNGIADPMTAWSQNRDWTDILQNAKETYIAMPKAYEHGLKCQSIIDSLESWSGARLLKRAQSGDTAAAREIIEKYIANGRIQKAMDGNEFIRMQGEIVQHNHDEAMKNWKSTRERLLEQDPAAESRWYTYGNDSKRYTFDEFCEFMDKMYAEQRANGPMYRNQFYELADQGVQQNDGVSEAIKMFEDAHKLSAQELKEEKDWRDLSAEEWDKMLEGIDKYIDAFKERLREMKEMQDEAAQKAAMEADPEMRTIAASSAVLAVATGFDAGASSETEESGEVSTEDGVDHEKNWTKKLKTDDQTVLMTAKEAQKMESNALSKYQEVQLVGTTSVGVSYTSAATECASVDEDDKKEKVWTITCIGADGISSKKCQNGKVLSSWELNYESPEDAKRVDDLIASFKNDENLRFAGMKDFWTKFLDGNMSKDDLTFTGDAWDWIR